MNIDKDTAELIVDAYRKINALKRLLKDKSYSDFIKFLESGNTMGMMLNKTLEDNSVNVVIKNLSETVAFIDDMKRFNSKNNDVMIHNKAQISTCLGEVLDDLKLLLVKINKQER